MISVNNLSIEFSSQKLFDNINYVINPNDKIALVGKNGAGKSTMLKIIAGLQKPTEGAVAVPQGVTIGYLPQQTAAQRDFPATVYEVVRSGCLSRMGNRPFYTKKEKVLALENMEKLGLSPLKNYCYRELSGGQQQRALIARALCATDKLLVLDEPITGLDPSAIQEFYQILGKLNRKDGVAILMVSHDIQNAVSQASKILHLGQKVLFYGTVEEYRVSEAGREFLGSRREREILRKGGG